jgi:uncharacterized protein YdeI (BOF family)
MSKSQILAAFMLPLLSLCAACAAEGDEAPRPQEAASAQMAAADPSAGWKDMLRRRREVSRNTVAGIKRHSHDGDFAFIRGHFIKKLTDSSFVFTDGKDRMEVRLDKDKLPKDFALGTDYMLWGQMHRENVIIVYMQALMLSPRLVPAPRDGREQVVPPPCEGKEGCRPFSKVGTPIPSKSKADDDGDGDDVEPPEDGKKAGRPEDGAAALPSGGKTSASK